MTGGVGRTANGPFSLKHLLHPFVHSHRGSTTPGFLTSNLDRTPSESRFLVPSDTDFLRKEEGGPLLNPERLSTIPSPGALSDTNRVGPTRTLDKKSGE